MGLIKGRQRFDVGTLGEVTITPQGGFSIPAYLTRTGVFDYVQDDGTVIREYRPPEEVFNSDSLATLPNAPLTHLHPTDPMTPKMHRKHNMGHVESGTVKQDGDKIAARTVWQAQEAVDAIRNGTRELSCGYNCDVDETPGVAPDGERYDRIQRNIRYNHVALVPDGRAGPEVRLRLDAKGNQRRDKEERNMEIEVIGGTKYEVGTDAHKAAVERRAKARKDAAATRAQLIKERDKERARADAAAADLVKAQKALATANSPQRLDRAVQVRDAVIRRARVVLPKETKLDGLSVPAIKLLAIKAYHTEIKLDGKSKDYLDGLFRAIPAQPDGATRKDGQGLRLDGNNRVQGGRVPAHLRRPPEGFQRNDEGGAPTMEHYRMRRDAAEEERHRRPLAMSKSNPNREIDGYPAVQGSMLETMR
jgi:hypothetical protein